MSSIRPLLVVLMVIIGSVPRLCFSSNPTPGYIAAGIPAIAAIYSASIGDKEGLRQLSYATALTMHNTFFLKKAVNKRRPDNSDNNSFPSGHTSAAFSGATYLQLRYGNQWGIPMYIASGLIGAERVHANKHTWTDVFAGAAIAYVYGRIFTTPNPKFWIDPKYSSKDKQIGLSMGFQFD